MLNYTSSLQSPRPIIEIANLEGAKFTLNNVYMSNCNLNARSFIKNAVNANPIVFTNFVFDQNVISQDVNLLYVQVANSVLINNVTINALTVLNEKDVNSQIFRINQIVNVSYF